MRLADHFPVVRSPFVPMDVYSPARAPPVMRPLYSLWSPPDSLKLNSISCPFSDPFSAVPSSRKSVPLSSLFSSFRVSRSLRLSPYTLVIRIQSPLGLLSVRSFAPCAESDEFRNRLQRTARKKRAQRNTFSRRWDGAERIAK